MTTTVNQPADSSVSIFARTTRWLATLLPTLRIPYRLLGKCEKMVDGRDVGFYTLKFLTDIGRLVKRSSRDGRPSLIDFCSSFESSHTSAVVLATKNGYNSD
jgi:hypothetical protein